jgi:hypothetical protein
MPRIAVIGDVGGHPDQLRRALTALGATDDRLPSDLTVIQVGDLVDRGPDSSGVVSLVAGYLDRQPAQWIQLAGNHDAQYVPGGSLFWPEVLEPAMARLLSSWWTEGLMRMATAVRTSSGEEYLVTHAGLTVGCWEQLGEPMTASSAALLLNDGAIPASQFDGPLWADAGAEVYEPWMAHYAAGGFVPYGQIHGHSSIVRYTDRSWRRHGRVRHRATVDWSARHTRVRIGGRTFIGVDPKHGREGAAEWQPLVLDDAEIPAVLSVA